MATISTVRLDIFEHASSPGNAMVQISYRLRASGRDLADEQRYRELVQLIGVDEGTGEDGNSELLPIEPIWDGPFVFGGTSVEFQNTREKTIPASALVEDQFFRRQEIRARVTLEPLLPETVSRDSNTVLRQPGFAFSA